MRNALRSSLVVIALTLMISGVFADYYVDINAADANGVGSIEKPWKSITRALSEVEGSKENPEVIHVAQGTYDKTHGEEFPLVMESNVSLIGAGGKTTILDATGFEASVIYCSDVKDLTIDGFTMTGGSGSRIPHGPGPDYQYSNEGGGIYCKKSFPAIRNCIIRDNLVIETADEPAIGGGIFCNLSSPRIENCIISNNKLMGIYVPIRGSLEDESDDELEASGRDGGISMWESSPLLTGCEISGNLARTAGGLRIEYNSSPIIKDCVIKDNMAGDTVRDFFQSLDGAGVYILSNSKPIFINCEISGNHALESGGGIFSQSPISLLNCTVTGNSQKLTWGAVSLPPASTDAVILENCLISDNSAGRKCGGIYALEGIPQGYVTPNVTNSIFWNNGDTPCWFGAANVTYCNIEGGYEGDGNINEDPMFEEGLRGDYYLSQLSAGQTLDSPCLNAGIGLPFMSFDPKWTTTRTDGLLDTDTIDMGYHYQPNVVFDLKIDPVKVKFTSGENLKLYFGIETAPATTNVDIYFIMLHPDASTYFGMDWTTTGKPLLSNFTLPPDLSFKDVMLFDLTIPNALPPIGTLGKYTFAIGAFQPGTFNFLSNVGMVTFAVK
jgi:hypothetical protein